MWEEGFGQLTVYPNHRGVFEFQVLATTAGGVYSFFQFNIEIKCVSSSTNVQWLYNNLPSSQEFLKNTGVKTFFTIENLMSSVYNNDVRCPIESFELETVEYGYYSYDEIPLSELEEDDELRVRFNYDNRTDLMSDINFDTDIALTNGQVESIYNSVLIKVTAAGGAFSRRWFYSKLIVCKTETLSLVQDSIWNYEHTIRLTDESVELNWSQFFQSDDPYCPPLNMKVYANSFLDSVYDEYYYDRYESIPFFTP